MKTPIIFNHELETVSASIGISEERFEELKEQSFEFLMSEKNPSRVAEKIYEHWSENEILCFATLYFSTIMDKMMKL
jgi:hypothetical protein